MWCSPLDCLSAIAVAPNHAVVLLLPFPPMHKPHQQPDKALLALERESRKLRHAKWSKVSLDPPIRRGWKRCYFLTQAARQRPDAFLLECILETINVSRIHWRRDFSPTKRHRRRQVHHLDQQLQMLENHHFGPKRSQLPEAWRFYFVRTPVFEHKSVAWKWSFRLQTLFELRIVPNLQTEAHILDPDTERRLAEIDSKLEPKGWARLNNLHGCHRRCYEERSAKEEFAANNASHRIRSAYRGDHETEKSTHLPADVLLRIVRQITLPLDSGHVSSTERKDMVSAVFGENTKLVKFRSLNQDRIVKRGLGTVIESHVHRVRTGEVHRAKTAIF